VLSFVILFVCNLYPEVILVTSPETPTPAASNLRDEAHQSFPANTKSYMSKQISWSLVTPMRISSEASLPDNSFDPFGFVWHCTLSGCPESAPGAGPEHL